MNEQVRPQHGTGAGFLRPLLLAGLTACFISTAAFGQGDTDFSQKKFHITIPRRSELTPVQKLNRKGVEEVNKHRYEDAEKTFYKAYLYDPADPFTLNNLGYISEVQGQVDKAEKFYQLAVQQGSYATIDRSTQKDLRGKSMMDALGTLHNLPMRINRINILGLQLLSEKRPFDAQVVFEQALKLDPENPFTLSNLAVAQEGTGDFYRALKNYQAAADMRSRAPVVVTLNRSARGKPVSEVALNSARQLRDRMQSMTPGEIQSAMLATHGVAALNQNDWASAKRDFLNAYKVDPQSAFSLNNRAYVAEHEGDLEGAKAFYESARNADNAQAPIGLATAAAAQGQTLDSVAAVSHDDVGAELTASAERRRGNGPIILRHRDGTEKDITVPLVLKPRNAQGDPIAPGSSSATNPGASFNQTPNPSRAPIVRQSPAAAQPQ